LISIVQYVEILYDPVDPDNPTTVIEQDREWLELSYTMNANQLNGLSPWVLRIVLGKKKRKMKRKRENCYKGK